MFDEAVETLEKVCQRGGVILLRIIENDPELEAVRRMPQYEGVRRCLRKERATP